MFDLLIALAAMCVLSGVVFWFTVRASRRLTGRATSMVGVIVGCVMVAYVSCLWGKPVLVTLFPSSSVVIWGNWFLFAAAFLAGITWTHGYGTSTRRVLLGTAILLIAAYSVVEPLLGESPRCRDAWVGGVCLQTSPDTCSPAAAATLLARFGIPAQESEMSELCLTRVGTMWQGLYRGLKLKTIGHPFKVEVFECSASDLLRDFDGPQILSVGLPPEGPHPAWYTDELGWSPGIRHSVVLIDQLPDGLLLVADPSVGYEFWTREYLDVLWLGRGLRLRQL